MSVDVRKLLCQMRTNSDQFVFMKPAPLRKDDFLELRVRITYRALYSAFRVATIRAGIIALRVHDLRHTAATRLVNQAGNLKMAMKLLRHEDISATVKYAAVLDEDLRAALDAMAEPHKGPKESPLEEDKLLTGKA